MNDLCILKTHLYCNLLEDRTFYCRLLQYIRVIHVFFSRNKLNETMSLLVLVFGSGDRSIC